LLKEGSFTKIQKLYVWYSFLSEKNDDAILFQEQQPIMVVDGQFQFSLGIDSIYTLTTTTKQQKGVYPPPPPPGPFPLPYSDDFEQYEEESEATYFADQSGSFQIKSTDGVHGKVLRQVVDDLPVSWCEEPNPITVIGDYQWSEVQTNVDIFIETKGIAGIAIGVTAGGCDASFAEGTFFSVDHDGNFNVSSDILGKNILQKGHVNAKSGEWHTLSLGISGDFFLATFDQQIVSSGNVNTTSGWAALFSSRNFVQFDNFAIGSDLPDFLQCGITVETENKDSVAQVVCPVGSVIVEIVFASFGTPSGYCNHFQMDKNCHASNSTSIVSALCMGRSNCYVPCSIDVFGDPCPNVRKRVVVQALCR